MLNQKNNSTGCFYFGRSNASGGLGGNLSDKDPAETDPRTQTSFFRPCKS